MEDKNRSGKEYEKMKNLAPGLGLVFGVSIGALFGMILGQNIGVFAGSGAGLGIIAGAVIYALASKKK